jgi:hypothetical protein
MKNSNKKAVNSPTKKLAALILKSKNRKTIGKDELVDALAGLVGTNSRKQFEATVKRLAEEQEAAAVEAKLAEDNVEKTEKRQIKKRQQKYKKIVNKKLERGRKTKRALQEHFEG